MNTITIILPNWLTYLVTTVFVLMGINEILSLYLWWLKQKLAKKENNDDN